jgi:predicted O-linked N-acetylglucosamine transferase (SPINDLY family)
MGIPDGSQICLVLGRLFKLHPDFDEALVDIILTSPENTVIVLIAEKISEWNDTIYERIRDVLESRMKMKEMGMNEVNTTDASTYEATLNDFMGKLRFVSYNYYSDLLISARVVLDTFPYGGK